MAPPFNADELDIFTVLMIIVELSDYNTPPLSLDVQLSATNLLN